MSYSLFLFEETREVRVMFARSRRSIELLN